MPSKIKSIFSGHKWAIIFALAVAIIVAYPQVWLHLDLKNDYRGIETIGASDDEDAWLSRVREVQDGHPFLSCVYLKEGKDDPYLFQPLGSIIIGSAGNALGLDLNGTVLFSRLFFSFLVFLIVYSFIFILTDDRLVSLASSSALFLASSLLSRWGIRQLLGGGSPQDNFLLLTRPVNPLMTWFFFFGFLLFFRLFLSKKRWYWGFLSAIWLGLSFYDYLYTWTFLFAFCGVLGLVSLIKRNWPDLKRIISVAGGAALVAIPYFINLWEAAAMPFFREIGARTGLLASHAPSFGLLVPLLFVIFLILFPKHDKGRFWFAFALLAAPLVALNQQVITGKTMVSSHYHWYFNTPLGVIFLLMIFFFLISRFRKVKITAAILLIAVSFYTGAFVQVFSYSAHQDKITEEQKYGPAMDWLSASAGKDRVVLANEEASNLAIIYTPLNLFYHPSAMYCFSAPEERLLDSLFLYYRLDGIGEDEAGDVFSRDRGYLSGRIYGMHYRETAGAYEGIPDEIISDWAGKYRSTFSMQAPEYLEAMLSKYGVDYIIWDRAEDAGWRLDQYSFLTKVFESGDLAVYER